MTGEDDLLDPSEIEALLAQANGGQAPQPAHRASQEPAHGNAGQLLDSDDIGALLREHGTFQGSPPAASKPTSARRPTSSSPMDHLLDQAEANLAAALSPNLLGTKTAKSRDVSGATAMQFRDLVQSLGSEERSELSMLQDVELDVRIELGRADLLIEEIVSLKAGSVVPLDKLAGDPVDILVNGKLIARGEVLVLNDNFCVRVAEILTPRE